MDTDGNIASYSWDFGDGNTGTGVGPVHTYNAPGNYTVKVTVVDNDGLEGTGQTTADITEVTQPPPDGIAEAEALYNTYCAGCHGVKGTDGFDPEVQGEDAEDIAEAIDEEPAMAFLADVLTSADIDAIANYLDEDGAPGDKDDDMDDHGDHDDDMDDHGDHDGDAHDNDDRDEDGDRHGRGNGNHDRQNANPFATATDATSTGGGGVHWATVLLAFFAVARRRWYMK
jgi:PKD repeat protein